MADGHPAHRDTSGGWPILKLFTAFRIALDLKKLALAGAGIFITSLGWWLLSWIFYSATPPQWKVYEKDYPSQKQAWDAFKRDRARWNLLHELAGPPTNDPNAAIRIDAGDVARNEVEFLALKSVVEGRRPIGFDIEKSSLLVDGVQFKVTNTADLEALKKLDPIPFVDVVVSDKDSIAFVAGKTLNIENDIAALRQLRADVQPLSSLPPASRELFDRKLAKPEIKPAGRFRSCPWNENRGPNPYLLVTGVLSGSDKTFDRGGFFTWLLHDQLPVLAEPIVKFVSPIYYLFKPEAGGWRNGFFLVFIILWNLAVWGYFGGAICRLSAVQFARNEKIPLTEAIDFVNQRAKHFFLAPVFPLGCLFVLTFILGVAGFLTGWTYFVGDIAVGLAWPLMILFGLIMAVLLVGLFAWPLMYPTIAIEGSDSFDALSRSYSYLYQAPWQFLAYAGTALAYGAAVVFFVGFMASLTVYMGKWGFSQAPGLSSEDAGRDRTPVYLFADAPTSFGWRDLFLKGSDWAEEVKVPPAGIGASPVHYELREDYRKTLSWNNRLGGWLVTLWLGLFFLLIVGFGYSYFWTASTIIYFLMRKKVDDTDFDEIYLEEDEIPPPPPPAPKEPVPAPAAKPGAISLNVVEPPKPS